MNLKTKLAATILMVGSVSMAQATTYDVQGVFSEPTAMMGNTIFNGTFDWDTAASNVDNLASLDSSLMGMQNSAMAVGAATPNLTLNQNVISSISGTVVTATVFKNNSSSVFRDNGYDAKVEQFSPGSGMYGIANNPNTANAYFTFAFDIAGGVLSETGLTTIMQYGDCTAGSMMGMMCMTGFGDTTGTHENENLMGGGNMGGFSQSLTISEVSAVPVPAAAWLFGGALVSLFGANRRKNVLPA